MSNPDQSPALSLEEFTHWLNDRRMLDVSEAFHAIVSRYSEATEAAAMAATVPHEKLTHEIDMVLTDPDTKLSPGAVRALQWCRTWVSVPLQLAQAPVAGQPAEPSPAYWAVIAKTGEGVLFKEHADAQWTLTGRGAGSDGFGVPTIGDAFRDAYDDEQDEFKLVRVQIVPDAAPKGDSNG